VILIVVWEYREYNTRREKRIKIRENSGMMLGSHNDRKAKWPRKNP